MSVKQWGCPVYFLAAYTPGGFIHHYDKTYDPLSGERAFLLKGGPGCGKSTLLKQCAASLSRQGEKAELFLCSADPDSLDGVRFPEKGLCLLDATPPHSIEPRFPGICEREIPLFEGWDSKKLREARSKLMPLFHQEELLRQRVNRYISAIGELMEDGYRADCRTCDFDKAQRFAKRLACSWNGKSKEEGQGKAEIRFLSGITSQGFLFLEETVSLQCDTVLVLEDDWGASSGLILSVLKECFFKKGYDCIVCPSPLAPHRKTDHLLVPELSLAVCTESWFSPIHSATERRIHSRRFRQRDGALEYTQRLRFYRRAVEELMADSSFLMSQANQIHRRLEEGYGACTDYRVIHEQTARVLNEITA